MMCIVLFLWWVYGIACGYTRLLILHCCKVEIHHVNILQLISTCPNPTAILKTLHAEPLSTSVVIRHEFKYPLAIRDYVHEYTLNTYTSKKILKCTPNRPTPKTHHTPPLNAHIHFRLTNIRLVTLPPAARPILPIPLPISSPKAGEQLLLKSIALVLPPTPRGGDE